MGRGGRAQTTLVLKSSMPVCDTRWLDALKAYERAVYHEQGSCQPPDPYSEPRFVTQQASNQPGTPERHTFTYFETPEELLGALIKNTRLAQPNDTYVLEYDFKAYKFREITLMGEITGYLPPAIRPAAKRPNRARNLCVEHGTVYYSRDLSQERFAIFTRDSNGYVTPSALASMDEANVYSALLATTGAALVAFYDLDVSDTPVPIRFSLRYVDLNSPAYEVTEALLST